MILDWQKHGGSVRQFMDFYQLKNQSPGEKFLIKILESFANLPYENISKIIKWNEKFEENHLRLPDEVISEHVDFHFGGTCFSLTFYLQTILSQNGFSCYPVTADMRAGKNIHCALIVILNNQKYLVDPGYLLNRPMLIDHSKLRLYRSEQSGVELQFDSQDNTFSLFTFNHEGKKWRYSFADVPVSPEKFLKYWKESFHRNSMHGICLTKVKKDGLIYIHKNFMRETDLSGKKNYNIRTNYHETIQTIFGIKQELVEKALASLDENMKRVRDLGLFVEKQTANYAKYRE